MFSRCLHFNKFKVKLYSLLYWEGTFIIVQRYASGTEVAAKTLEVLGTGVLFKAQSKISLHTRCRNLEIKICIRFFQRVVLWHFQSPCRSLAGKVFWFFFGFFVCLFLFVLFCSVFYEHCVILTTDYLEGKPMDNLISKVVLFLLYSYLVSNYFSLILVVFSFYFMGCFIVCFCF